MTHRDDPDPPDPADTPDVDAIMSTGRNDAFTTATGPLIPVTEVVTESRFYRVAVHPVAGVVSVVVVLGLLATGILAVVLQIPGAAWVASTCGGGAAAITLAVYGRSLRRMFKSDDD